MSVIRIMSARGTLSGLAWGVGSTRKTLPLHSSMTVAWLIGVILRSPADVGTESTDPVGALAGVATGAVVPAELGAGRSLVLQARQRANSAIEVSSRMTLGTPAMSRR